MDDIPGQSAIDEPASLPTTYAYSPGSRFWAAGVTAIASVPIVYVLWFLVSHPPARDELGAIFLVLLFLLAPPLFAALRYGDAFRRFQVEPYKLTVKPLWRPWSVRWRDINRVVRRTRGRGAGRPFKVSIQVGLEDGKTAWIALFDSSLPDAEELYAQVLAHTPHIRPKELVDETSRFRRFG